MAGNNPIFYSKVLLFGEYTVLLQGNALSIPYTHYMGELSFINENKYTDLHYARTSNKKLRQYHQYLLDTRRDPDMTFNLDLEQMKEDIDAGLYFESSIPQGYGLGSSGAMVAAVFSRYAVSQMGGSLTLNENQLLAIRKGFSIMESYFHGTSSGLDPLLCYLKTPVLIQGMEHIQKVDIQRKKNFSTDMIFLLDTGVPEKTEGLVMLFRTMYDQPEFKLKVDDLYIPASNHCIDHLLKGNRPAFYNDLAMLSEFQLDHMKPMIPAGWAGIWRDGLEHGNYFLKLLGSGGGGYILGFTSHPKAVKKIFKDQGKDLIIVSGG